MCLHRQMRTCENMPPPSYIHTYTSLQQDCRAVNMVTIICLYMPLHPPFHFYSEHLNFLKEVLGNDCQRYRNQTDMTANAYNPSIQDTETGLLQI